MEITATDLIANNSGALSELQTLHLQNMASGSMGVAFACFAGIPVANIFLPLAFVMAVTGMVVSGVLGMYFCCRSVLCARAARGIHCGVKKITGTAVRRCGIVLMVNAMAFYALPGAAKPERGVLYDFYFITRPRMLLGWRRA